MVKQFYISEKEKMDMSFLFCHDQYSILATVFASFPLPLKRHCIQTGAVSGLMAERVPESAFPEGMTRREYADAVRYGGFYHDIAAYLAHNEYDQYPAVGYKLLSEQISEKRVPALIRQVILETVRYSQTRYDSGGLVPLHAGICAIANQLDMALTPSSRFKRNKSVNDGANMIGENAETFPPQAMKCFEGAWDDIAALYRQWKERPPMWKFNDLKPVFN